MLSDEQLVLMPSRALRDELLALVAGDDLSALTRRQPGDPEEPQALWIGGDAKHRGYPMVEIPFPGRSGTLWVGGMPGWRTGSLQGELEAIHAAGVRHVVCLLPLCDIRDLYEIQDYSTPARARFGDGFHLVEVMNHEVPPQPELFDAAVGKIDACLARGEAVLVHCAVGCGRTGMLVACLLAGAGMDPREAILTYRRHRGCGPETSEQVAYVMRYARLRRGA